MASSYEEMLLNQSAANSAFNASQAQLNRNWEEAMSNSAHQREVKDLIAAGLNPVLSANSGASWSSVGNAAADPSSAAGLASLAVSKMQTAAQIEMSKISAEAAKAAASMTAGATMYAANTAASASRDVSGNNLLGTMLTNPTGIAALGALSGADLATAKDLKNVDASDLGKSSAVIRNVLGL